MTGAAIGMQTVWGMSNAESAFGTPATVDRFLEVVSESLKRNQILLTSAGLRGGARNLHRGSRRAVSGRDATGDVNYEVATTGFGRLFHAILGAAAAPVSLGGSPAAYTQVYSLGSMIGRSYTLQKQLYDESQASIQTLTYPGAKVVNAEFATAVNQFLTLKVGWDAQDERSDIAAASASYTTQNLFNFAQAVLSIGGTPIANVLSCNITINNELRVDARFLGNQGLKGEQAANGFPTVTGSLSAEVLNATLYNDFTADTAVALSLAFTGNTISGANAEKLVIDIPEIHMTGETPQVGGPGVVDVSIPWEAATDSAGDAGMKITLTTKDATD